MQQRYEYTFVRLKIGIFSNRAEHEYQETIHRHTRARWRLVQVFSPGIGFYGLSLIPLFEPTRPY